MPIYIVPAYIVALQYYSTKSKLGILPIIIANLHVSNHNNALIPIACNYVIEPHALPDQQI